MTKGFRELTGKFRLAVSVLALSASTAAFAQTQSLAAGGDSGEIVVTANKREQNVSDVPISITAFSSSDIDRLRINSVQDYARLTPNVGFSNDGSPASANITIRGISDLGGAVNSVVTYIDEISVTPAIAVGSSGIGSGANDVNLADIERVEVLRGPQGVNFGRSALGGAINITTVKPGPDLFGQTDLELGSFGTGRVRAIANLPIAQGVYLRGQTYYKFSNGWLRNIGPSGESNSQDSYGGVLALRLVPDDRTLFDVRVQHSNLKQALDDGVATGTLNSALPALGFTQPIDEGQGFWPENRRTVSTNMPTFTRVEKTLLNVRFSRDFDFASLILVAGYLDGKVRRQQDSDFTSFDAFIDQGSTQYDSLSLEARLQSNSDGPFSWTIGVNSGEDNSQQSFVRTFGAEFGPLFGLPPFLWPLVTNLNIIDETSQSRVTSTAVFGDASLKLFQDRLTLSVGGRFSRDRFQGGNADNSQLFTPIPVGFVSSVSARSEAFNPRFNILFAATPDINIYATASRGYKPAGATIVPLATNPETGELFPAEYGKETMWNYEAGIKGKLFDGAVRFNLSAFLMKWKDIQVINGYFDAETFSVFGLTQNAAAAKSKGVEFDMTIRPWEALTLGIAVGYNDARFTDYPDALSEDALTGEPVVIDASGNRLPFAPKWSGSFTLNYRQPVGNDWNAVVGADWSIKGLQYTNAANIDVRLTDNIPKYDILNAQIGIENPRYTVLLFAQNLTDNNFATGYNGNEILSGARAVLVPRSFGIRLVAKFGVVN